jgi:hypothetical protein
MIRNPEDKRKTRINISTPDFKNIIKKVPDHLEFFTSLGFISSTNFLEFDAQYLNKLDQVLNLVNSRLEALSPPVSNFVMNAPWKRAESLDKLQEKTSEIPLDKPQEKTSEIPLDKPQHKTSEIPLDKPQHKTSEIPLDKSQEKTDEKSESLLLSQEKSSSPEDLKLSEA